MHTAVVSRRCGVKESFLSQWSFESSFHYSSGLLVLSMHSIFWTQWKRPSGATPPDGDAKTSAVWHCKRRLSKGWGYNGRGYTLKTSLSHKLWLAAANPTLSSKIRQNPAKSGCAQIHQNPAKPAVPSYVVPSRDPLRLNSTTWRRQVPKLKRNAIKAMVVRAETDILVEGHSRLQETSCFADFIPSNMHPCKKMTYTMQFLRKSCGGERSVLKCL